MIADHLTGIEQFEAELWKLADNLRANSNLASNEYFMPILGLIFLRHATNRYYEAMAAIAEDMAAGRMPERPLVDADFAKRRALALPEAARFDALIERPKGGSLGAAVTTAMETVEDHFAPLAGQLPKDYERFEDDVLEEMMRTFDSEALRTASGDVFGRIYEYFLAEFSKQGAHDNGEFFTPPSIVQTIVNVIEPDHGVVLDPACGSGGMFVQSSHFIEDEGEDTMKRVTFYGHEKNETTARLAQINLAVHGLQGTIRAGNEAITYYKDPHELVGKCDFVMANPPFNVDEVDAAKVKGDQRLPFGLPGVNKERKISNANYLWLSYFYSYLNEIGRAGVVMSSQASSAMGREDAKVRQKLVETGAVDVMIDVRGNFFYTRAVPCQLWFLDRAKERDPERADRVLMLDARSIYRKVSRAIYDFAPEQQKNIAAIVWLYRGKSDRFLKLVESYLDQAVAAGQATHEPLAALEDALGKVIDLARPFATEKHDPDPLAEPWKELTSAQGTLSADIETFAAEVAARAANWNDSGKHGTRDNAALHAVRERLHDMANRCRDLTTQIDLAAKLVARTIDVAVKELEARESDLWANAETSRARRALEDMRDNAMETLRRARYFVRQADWLQERFPEAELRDVEGLVKLVDRSEIEAHDWSLTPGRYVGVVADGEDEDFDFETALRSIHIDLVGLNEEAAVLAARIAPELRGVRCVIWQEVALGDCFTIKHGWAFKSQYFGDSGRHIVLTPGNFHEPGGFRSRPGKDRFYTIEPPDDFVLRSGDLVIAMTEQGEGLLGSSALIPEDGSYLHNQRIGLIENLDENKLIKGFLYRLFNTPQVRAKIRATASGTKVRHTAPTRIYSVRVAIPPVPIQRKVSDILSVYDDLIENNRRRITLLEEAARLLYREWFVRFRLPGHEHVKIIDRIPQGWKRLALSDLADFVNGYPFKPAHLGDDGLPIVKIPELKSGVTEKTPRNRGDSIPEKYHLGDGDLIFSWSGTLAVNVWACGPALLNQHLFHVVPKNRVGRGFLMCALREALSDFNNQTVGATMKHIRRSALNRVFVALPDRTKTSMVEEMLQTTYAQLVVLHQQNRKLALVRDLLVPRLMSGEIAV